MHMWEHYYKDVDVWSWTVGMVCDLWTEFVYMWSIWVYVYISKIFILIGPDGEPKVTHGYTLVSDLTLMEVAKTINVGV